MWRPPGGRARKSTGADLGVCLMIHQDRDSSSTTVASDIELDRRPDVLFLEEVAEMLRVSRSTIERRRRDGTFPVAELPSFDRRPRWSRRAIEQFLDSGRWSRPMRGRPRRRIR